MEVGRLLRDNQLYMTATKSQFASKLKSIGNLRKSFGLPHMPDLGDMRLNKSGTVGTEPIGKVQPNRSVKRYTEVKLGKLGKIDIPRSSK